MDLVEKETRVKRSVWVGCVDTYWPFERPIFGSMLLRHLLFASVVPDKAAAGRVNHYRE